MKQAFSIVFLCFVLTLSLYHPAFAQDGSHRRLGVIHQATQTCDFIFIPAGIPAAGVTIPTIVGFAGNVVRLQQKAHAPFWGIFGTISGVISLAVSVGLLSAYVHSIPVEPCGTTRAGFVGYHSSLILISLATLVISSVNLSLLRYRRRKRIRKPEAALTLRNHHRAIVFGTFR